MKKKGVVLDILHGWVRKRFRAQPINRPEISGWKMNEKSQLNILIENLNPEIE